jgi:hypothetical protein
MSKKALIAALAALALAVPASAFAGGDPVSAVKADLGKLSSDVQTAHDAAILALGKVTSDAQKGDVGAVRADLQAFRQSRGALAAPLKSDVEQLRTDLGAAKDAKVDLADVKQLLHDTRSANKAAREEVRNAVKAARDAVKALRASLHSGTR